VCGKEGKSNFNTDEYVLCDKRYIIVHNFSRYDQTSLLISGYPLTQYTIRPFAGSELTVNPREARAREAWNFWLAKVRSGVEHAFGMLKNRFLPFKTCRGLIASDNLRLWKLY